MGSVVSLDEFMAHANSTFSRAASREGKHAAKLAAAKEALIAVGARRRKQHVMANATRSTDIRQGVRIVQSSATQGLVRALYTFGAPGTAEPQLRNGADDDGCFPGLRMYNSGRMPGWAYGYYVKNDPVTWITNDAWYAH